MISPFPTRRVPTRLALLVLALMALMPLRAAWAAHAIAWGEQPRYPADFTHFEYVNPQAPRDGEVRLDGFGSFDKLNPFSLKGLAAAGSTTLLFETLAESSDDEPFTMYGLLADDMVLAPDGLSIVFRLNAAARFSDGTPVLADDVVQSFRALIAKGAHPRFKQAFADVRDVQALDDRRVRFEFRRRNHEIHMIVGLQLPIFSRRWTQGRPLDQLVQEAPIASGPYRVDQVDWGKSIRYVRNPDYWGKALPVRRGMFNFARVTYKYFKDETARLEGFKAGEFDWIFENSARNWARGHTGRRYRSGEIQRREFPHANAAGIQGFAMNTRRPRFADVRVRHALALAMDFEWMNRQIFYGQYRRSPSYFTNSDMQARGRPDAAERALLEPLRDRLAPEVFDEAPEAPNTDAPNSLRGNLREARRLLSEAGWNVADDGVLRNARGEAFSFEVLTYSKSLERIAVPWVRSLEKLGIEVRLRTTDPALYKKRDDEFDFDVIVQSFRVSQTPGNELLERFGSAAADEKGSDNAMGIRDPAVDSLLQTLLASRSRAELVTAARALDRVLRVGWYLVPHFHAPAHRVAWQQRLRHPQTLPRYYSPDTWMLKTWWEQRG